MLRIKDKLVRLIALAPVVLGLAGCSPTESIDLQSTTIHRIALITPHGPGQYLVGSNRSSSSITGNISLLGAVANATQSSNSTNGRFNAEIATAKYSLGDDLGAALEAQLRQEGFEVTRVTLPTDKPTELHQDLSTLAGQADAALDVAIIDAGYAYATGHPYEPDVNVVVQLTDLRTQKPLFRRTYTYGRYAPLYGSTNDMIRPMAGYEFRGGGDLLKEPDRAIAGLKSSVPPIASRIGATLKHS